MMHTTGNLTGIKRGEYALMGGRLFIKRGRDLQAVATSGVIGALVRQYGDPSGTIEYRQRIAARIAEEMGKRG